MKSMTGGNCTIDSNSECTNCRIDGRLECKWNKRALNNFLVTSMPVSLICLTAVATGAYVTSNWWYLIGYFVYFILMFNVFEIRFLCSHCPYYAKSGNKLECLANHGSPKLWKYRPGPLNGFEKALMIVLISTIFYIGPMGSTVAGVVHMLMSGERILSPIIMALAALALMTAFSSTGFVISLRRNFCSKCVNFSCPLNKVDKPVVDQYLLKNDVMREAWIKSGYQWEDPHLKYKEGAV